MTTIVDELQLRIVNLTAELVGNRWWSDFIIAPPDDQRWKFQLVEFFLDISVARDPRDAQQKTHIVTVLQCVIPFIN